MNNPKLKLKVLDTKARINSKYVSITNDDAEYYSKSFVLLLLMEVIDDIDDINSICMERKRY